MPVVTITGEFHSRHNPITDAELRHDRRIVRLLCFPNGNEMRIIAASRELSVIWSIETDTVLPRHKGCLTSQKRESNREFCLSNCSEQINRERVARKLSASEGG